jgi:hypothetical protein
VRDYNWGKRTVLVLAARAIVRGVCGAWPFFEGEKLPGQTSECLGCQIEAKFAASGDDLLLKEECLF